MTTTQQLTRELESGRCFCKKKKRPGATFCPGHLKLLSHELKTSLFRSTGPAYVKAYAAARERFERGTVA